MVAIIKRVKAAPRRKENWKKKTKD